MVKSLTKRLKRAVEVVEPCMALGLGTSSTSAMKIKEQTATMAPASHGQQQQPPRSQYQGVRMRKWGKWVAEIRERHKRARIWLSSYATPVFYLRGRSAPLNFPDEIPALAQLSDGEARDADGGMVSAASIRKKAIEVGSRVDALQTGMVAPPHDHHEQQPKRQRAGWSGSDVNRAPSPESSHMERGGKIPKMTCAESNPA